MQWHFSPALPSQNYVQGECDIVLVDAPTFDDDKSLALHVRTTLRYFYSYIDTAALRIGEDILEVTSFGQYALNDVDHADLQEGTIGGYPIYHSQPNEKTHSFDIVVGPTENITLSTFKDIVSVTFKGGTKKHYRESVGLVGSFSGETLARDGTPMEIESSQEAANAYGQEWQVKEDAPMLFRAARAPQAPQQCLLPSATGVDARRRRLGEGVARTKAERACTHVVDGKRKEACISDVIAVDDVDIAQFGTY